MIHPGMVNAVAVLLLISALIAATGFVGMYASFAPWRSNEVGRSMMLLATSLILLILTGIFLNLLGPHYPFRDAFRLSTYVVLNVALWRQLRLLVKVLNRKTHVVEDAAVELPTPRESEEAEDKQSVI